MAVTFSSGFKPRDISVENSFHAAPVKESSGVKENEQTDSDAADQGKIDNVPILFRSVRIRKRIKLVRHVTNDGGDRGAADVNAVCLLRQDHAGQSQARPPEIVARAEAPEPEQSENEHHREKHEPDFVNRVTPVKDEAGRD